MDETVDESFNHLDHSFQARRKVRPVIESDSEEEDDSDNSTPKADSIEDSFDDEEFLPKSQKEDSHKSRLSFASDDVIESTDDESNDELIMQDSFEEDTESAEGNASKDSLEKVTKSINGKLSKDSVEKVTKSAVERRSNNSFKKVTKSPEDSEKVTERKTSIGSFRNSTENVTIRAESFEKGGNISEEIICSDEDITNYDEASFNKKAHSSMVQIVEANSVVELSSDDEAPPTQGLKQLTMESFLRQPKKVAVGQSQYEDQERKISSLEGELLRAKNAMRIIKLSSLPDKGQSLINKAESLQVRVQEERNKLANMVIDKTIAPVTVQNKIGIAWDEIEAAVDDVGPRTFGKKGIARFNSEKQLAVETLDHLHKSLDTCPTENDLAEDPKYLKVELMTHQRRALAWLLWRERQKPSGGLLADDMGLGKTLTMISLIMKSKELGSDEHSEKENSGKKYPGGTLVVCPASLINQWSGEIESKVKRGLLSVEVYHGAKRETKAKRLAENDVVITTYGLIPKESDKDGTLFRIRWRRIILDEAHQIRNFKSQTAEAVFRLSGKSRWSLTGTPVHNKEADMYAVLKFMRCSPFDDFQVWKRWISDKSTGGGMRLHAVISTLMLRRTKAELMEKGSLQQLPNRTWELISVELEKDEMDVYQKVLIFSRTLFAQFLHQRAEKDQDVVNLRFTGGPPDPNGEYFKMRNRLLKLNRVKEVSQHEILVLLLRLRQICCHPSLIKKMLQADEDLGEAQEYEDTDEMNLLEQLNRLDVNDDDAYNPSQGLSDENVGLKEASKGFLNPSNPVFKSERQSSKIKTLIKLLKNKVSDGDKAIIVSQWTSLLELIALHLNEDNVPYDSLTGKTVTHKRMAIVDNFNNPRSDTKVLLLSLTAGGVGLNLVGANHLFLLDLHWNPQLESQAQDRIYRMGQKKPIFVYKFMAVGTIEERIKALQDKKLEIANSMLTGSKRVVDSKLSLQDLKMLFDFK